MLPHLFLDAENALLGQLVRDLAVRLDAAPVGRRVEEVPVRLATYFGKFTQRRPSLRTTDSWLQLCASDAPIETSMLHVSIEGTGPLVGSPN
jgi:hypothetical protein